MILLDEEDVKREDTSVSLEFEDEVTIERLEGAIEELDRRIKTSYLEVKKVFVEAESIMRPQPA